MGCATSSGNAALIATFCNCLCFCFLLLIEGGSEKQGSVISVGDDTDNYCSYRSWVKIIWDAGKPNDYRRGHEGSLDIKCITAAEGEMYYRDHLPTLGNHHQQQQQ